MINHYIVMASAYSIGKRIVLDYHSESELQLEQIKKELNNQFNDFPLDEDEYKENLNKYFNEGKSLEEEIIKRLEELEYEEA